MSKFIFKRGIKNQAFIDALNELKKDPNSFWSKIVSDKNLFIAIREEYINVYYKGNSICKLSFQQGSTIGETHYKYLVKPNQNEYVKSENGGIDKKSMNVYDYFMFSLSEIESIKKSSLPYAGDEKIGVHSIITKKPNILDVEITFGKEDRETDRIDFLSIKDSKLVFYEAKHFSNKEIRSQNTPPVLEQIKKYEVDLIHHKDEIIESYKLVLENLFALGIAENRIQISCILSSVINCVKMSIFAVKNIGYDSNKIFRRRYQNFSI